MSKTPCETVLIKYDWAKQHIKNLESAVDRFRQANANAIGRKYDFEAGEVIFYVAYAPVVPDDLRLMLGDALHNLRSTLDHLACALVSAADPTNDCSHTSFPIFDTAEAYQSTSRSKVPGLRQPLYQILDAIQPYSNGLGHNLWKLHRLDIVDKHRLLLSIAAVPVANSRNPDIKGGLGAAASYFQQLMFAGVNLAVIPMEAGCELGRAPISQEHDYVRFAFDVAINEPNILEGMPTFLFLRIVAEDIRVIVSNFAGSLQ